MSVTSCLLRKILTSSSTKFEASRICMRTSFLPVLVVYAFKCLHTGCINLSWVDLRPHYPITRKGLIPPKVKDVTVSTNVSVSTIIDCACMTTIDILCSSAAHSVLWFYGLMACIGSGEWMPGTLNVNCWITHLIFLMVCSIEGNFMAVTEFVLGLLDWNVPAPNHTAIGKKTSLSIIGIKNGFIINYI